MEDSSGPSLERKPLIVLDGANIAHAHNDRLLSLVGIKSAMRFWQERGHEVACVLPRTFSKHLGPADVATLDNWRMTGALMQAPSGDDDDLYCLACARAIDGSFIVTNDLFRDHITKWRELFGEAEAAGLVDFLQHRRIQYSFRKDDFIPSIVMAQKAMTARVRVTEVKRPEVQVLPSPPVRPLPPRMPSSSSAASSHEAFSSFRALSPLTAAAAAVQATTSYASAASASALPPARSYVAPAAASAPLPPLVQSLLQAFAASPPAVRAVQAQWQLAFAAGAAICRGDRTVEPLSHAEFDFVRGPLAPDTHFGAERAVYAVLSDLASEAKSTAALDSLLPSPMSNLIELWTPSRIKLFAQTMLVFFVDHAHRGGPVGAATVEGTAPLLENSGQHQYGTHMYEHHRHHNRQMEE
jgi:hypothetical protein